MAAELTFGVWFLIGAALVFWMQAGFAMVETGFTRAKNAGNIIMKNLMDFCIGTVVFSVLGFSLMMSEDYAAGVIGLPNFKIFSDYENFINSGNASSFVFNLVFCATAATIVSGAMAERTKFSAYCIYSGIISLIVYPIEAGWVWNSQGWLNKLGFIDGTNGQLRLDLSDKPQVIWTESNKTLTFFYGGKVYVGDTFNGYTVTNVWSDAQVTNSSQTGKPDWAMTVSQKIARKTIIVPAEGSVWGAVTKVVIDESFSLVKPNSTRSWFDLNNQLTTISGLENLNTENVETMDYMFSGYGGASLNVSNLNTSKVKSMRLMFSNSSLTNLDLSNFGTSNVTDMSNMFANCAELQTLTFSDKFKTQKVTSMSGLFSGCNKINNLDITSFDMTNVTNVDYMFENCTGLKNMKMLYFNVGSNVNGINVFRNVTGLTVKVDLREEECTNLKSTLSKLGFTSTTGTIEFKKVELRPFNPRF